MKIENDSLRKIIENQAAIMRVSPVTPLISPSFEKLELDDETTNLQVQVEFDKQCCEIEAETRNSKEMLYSHVLVFEKE